MVPALRPLQPLLGITTPQWGSRLRPGHAFQVQRCLLHDNKNEEEGFPYFEAGPWSQQSPRRKEMLRRLRFPRKYMPLYGKIWWTLKWTPQLLRTLIILGVRYPRRSQYFPPEAKGVVVKGRIGRLFYNFVSQQECLDLLNTTMRPWGFFRGSSGPSMLPTFGANPAIIYSSYTYTNREDVKIGHIVIIVTPFYDDHRGGCWIKRVAALEGDLLHLIPRKPLPEYRYAVKKGKCFVLGDNPDHSGDSREFGGQPIKAVWTKVRWRWGLDGFQRAPHDRSPWLENKVMMHLASVQDRCTQDGSSIKQPEKIPTVMPRASVVASPRPPPLNKQRKDPRKKP